jgi:hypothetical protein
MRPGADGQGRSKLRLAHGPRDFRRLDHGHFVTTQRTDVFVAQPRGAVGTICVRLRPEAAAPVLDERLQYFLDAQIGLDDLFGAGRVSLLQMCDWPARFCQSMRDCRRHEL